MRIGLLTLPLETGYGSILQAYALKTVLTRQGHEVILIRRLVKKKRFNGWNILKRSVKKYIFRKPACVFYDKKIYDEYPVITQHTQPLYRYGGSVMAGGDEFFIPFIAFS